MQSAWYASRLICRILFRRVIQNMTPESPARVCYYPLIKVPPGSLTAASTIITHGSLKTALCRCQARRFCCRSFAPPPAISTRAFQLTTVWCGGMCGLTSEYLTAKHFLICCACDLRAYVLSNCQWLGATWSTPNATALENPNAKVCMTGSGKNVFVAFNPSKTERNPMALASLLGETTWDEFCILDESQHVTFACKFSGDCSGLNSTKTTQKWKEDRGFSCYSPYRLDPTPIVFNNSIYTTYSADTSKGIKLAVTAVPS